jgi:hypothetical protein
MDKNQRGRVLRRGGIVVAISLGVALALQQLQDQQAVMEAIGGAEKMAAQEVANYNAMVRAGKDPLDAQLLATQQLANAQASASSGIQQQTQQIQNNNQIQQAGYVSEYSGMQKKSDLQLAQDKAAAVSNQQRLASQQAYNQTLKEGGTEEDAQNRSRAVAGQYEDQIAAAADRVKGAQIAINDATAQWRADLEGIGTIVTVIGADYSKLISQQNQIDQATAQYNAQLLAKEGGSQFNPMTMPRGDLTFQGYSSGFYNNGGTGKILDTGFKLDIFKQAFAALTDPNAVASSFVSKGDYAGAIKAVEAIPAASGFGGKPPDNSAQMAQVDTLTQVLNSQTTDKTVQASNIQSEIAWLNTQPETIARDQKIADLQQSMDSLKNATVSNTAALTNLNTPGNTTAYADPLLHTELMSGGDTSYAKYFYQNPTTPAPIQMKDPGPAANTNTPQTAPSVIIQVQPGVQADQFIVARAQIQRAVSGALSR